MIADVIVLFALFCMKHAIEGLSVVPRKRWVNIVLTIITIALLIVSITTIIDAVAR